ncbi:hypothetical protein THAOC_14705 [Thalassiosira oceanica]|uniref:Uncharacterized protein n=1 Tax=Thalassiosira oceanica TaxID=159749 RepID=K0SGP3_THAOC|nr:hypothetical protein THAOC_14705 [Thalassiosira oceanica]|eukprot:EJK64550.1 hypothetical protein THAOC_14705 [Thalassiosira oceanica]
MPTFYCGQLRTLVKLSSYSTADNSGPCARFPPFSSSSATSTPMIGLRLHGGAVGRRRKGGQEEGETGPKTDIGRAKSTRVPDGRRSRKGGGDYSNSTFVYVPAAVLLLVDVLYQMAWKRGIGTFHEPRRDAPRRCERRRGNGGTPKTTDRLPSVEFIHSLGVRSQFWSAARQMANSPRRQCPQAPSKEPRSVIG